MQRYARSVIVTVATLTPLTALATGEAAKHYDDSNKGVYAKQQLLRWSRSFAGKKIASRESSESGAVDASAWLGPAPPKVPYLLSISTGDDPAVVLNTLLEGAKVLGSYEERACETLARFTRPTSPFQLCIHKIATRYVTMKKVFHGDLSMGFGTEADDVAMDAMVRALRDLKCSEEVDESSKEQSDWNGAGDRELAQTRPAYPVFLIGDFDALGDLEAERWLRWTHQVSSEGLAHVVLLTFAPVTPSKAQWLQTRHKNGLFSALDGSHDFVSILLRIANGQVDFTSAEEKLCKVAEMYKLRLLCDPTTTSWSTDLMSDQNSGVISESNKYGDEIEIILTTSGNWWSDINEICRRLKENNLNDVTHPDARLAMIHEVCNSFVKDTESRLLEALHLDRSLELPRKLHTSNESVLPASVGRASDVTETEKVLSALGAWKCFETLTGVVPVSGGSSFVCSPQHLLDRKSKTPLDCVSPIDALLPFNYREGGERKFLDLIDHQLLLLRPKDAVEIGVIPCKNAALIAPCWIQTRPVVKKIFEKIHKSDMFYKVILEFDRHAANVEMQNEIEQYEREIVERRKFFFERKSDFAVLQFSMTPAEKAQREAELALLDVELQAKDVYLKKLQSLQTL
uniref:Uncharacterized protein n=1 Tax=Peronospora matthiolae TaxID=2874970 RepID=A0AAV1T8D5_9STRA